MFEPICPNCNDYLEKIETLEMNVYVENSPFVLDIENWWCPRCDGGFKVEAYYYAEPHHYGTIEQWR